MKYFVLIILFFAAMSFAQVGKYSHIVAGGFNRAGQRLANGFACWDQKASRFGNLPRASFAGGRVSDIATAGKGFLAVGDFTSVNGMQANGIAFFDGSKWCAFPHLNLYYYVKPFPAPTTIQYPYNRNAVAGSATGISAIGNDYYVFGGQVAGRTRFNQIGAVQTNVAGLVKLTFDGTGNFTVGQIAGYETQGGRGTGNPEPNNPGFPADSAPSGVIGTTKVRAAILNSVLNVYVHPSVGVTIPDNQANVWRWRQGDTQWLQVTQTAIAAFNVSSTVQTFNVLADRLTNVITDFDHDGTNLIVVGKFDNSANTTANVNYVNVATSNSASGQSITWTAGVNWPNVNNYNQTASTALRIAVESTGVFYVASTFTSVDATTTGDLNLLGVAQFFVYKVTSGSPVALGAASPRFDLPGQNPSFARLQVYNGRLYVFGNFAYYTWFNNQNNRWPRHYTRCISNAVYYDGTDFVDAYGGFTTLGNAYPLVAPNAQGADFLYVDGATNFYDLFSAGSVVAYNTDTKRWVNLASQRFSTRGSNGAASTQQGVDGTVAAVHFIRSQRSGINDAVVVAGQFDWYGNQYLASTAFLRTSTGTYEQLGGGLFVEENDSTYEADQTLPLYRAGLVADIEEIDNRFYAAGTFTKNTQGACLNNVASVSATNTGDVWTALGAGCDNAVVDLIAKGNDLYVAGAFTSCGGVDGTRRVARYDTKKGTWWALQAGLPDGVVYAMIWYRGNLLVGGQFTNTPAAYRSSLSTTANRNTGLWEWDGNRWAPLSGRCLKDCDGNTAFTFPFGNRFDPASRSVSNVRSLRTTGGNLYIHATVGGAAPSNVLVQFDGNTFKQYGTASGNCAKQGCIASNFSEVIVAGFTRPGENYNNNYLQYNPDRQNWVDTFTGFDNAPVIVASASNIALSLFSLFLIVLLAF